MFIHNCNISESLQFLVICRETLANIVDESSLEAVDKEVTKTFIYNEATDYQVLSMLVRGEMPEEKYNFSDEIMIFSELKDQLLMNYQKLSEYIDLDTATGFISEVNSVYPFYSSTKPILEHLHFSGCEIVVEEKPWVNKALKTAKDYWMPGGKGGELVQKGMGKGEKALKTAGSFYKKGHAKVQAAAQKGEAMRKAREAGGLKGLIANIKYKAPHARAMVMKAVKDAAAKAKELGKDPNALKIAGAALAALIAFGAYKLYKNKFSAAAKACKGLSGAEKKACMAKAKNQAIQAQIQDMRAASSACSKTKDPAKCKAAVQNKIAKLQKKLKG